VKPMRPAVVQMLSVTQRAAHTAQFRRLLEQDKRNACAMRVKSQAQAPAGPPPRMVNSLIACLLLTFNGLSFQDLDTLFNADSLRDFVRDTVAISLGDVTRASKDQCDLAAENAASGSVRRFSMTALPYLHLRVDRRLGPANLICRR
jgi:hypothetical protein